jgi:hypothetical protein
MLKNSSSPWCTLLAERPCLHCHSSKENDAMKVKLRSHDHSSTNSNHAIAEGSVTNLKRCYGENADNFLLTYVFITSESVTCSANHNFSDLFTIIIVTIMKIIINQMCCTNYEALHYVFSPSTWFLFFLRSSYSLSTLLLNINSPALQLVIGIYIKQQVKIQLFYPEDGGSRFTRNVGNNQPPKSSIVSLLTLSSHSEDLLFLVEDLIVSLISSRQLPGHYLNMGHDLFLTHPFQFIILSPHI